MSNLHIFISGIAGSGMSSLAHLALDFGFQVSGSDLARSPYLEGLEEKGAKIYIGQSYEEIKNINYTNPIYWFVHSSSIKNGHPELEFALDKGLKISKRDELINFIIRKHELKLLAVAGTNGKTTTTAMLAYLFMSLKLDPSYLLGSKVGFGDGGRLGKKGGVFVLEADEFDRNFLSFKPDVAILTSISYDHKDIYPTVLDYKNAFLEFLNRADYIVAFNSDLNYLNYQESLGKNPNQFTYKLFRSLNERINNYSDIKLTGLHNRQNAALARKAAEIFYPDLKKDEVSRILSNYPGSHRRMEKINDNSFSDYAHHPKEIAATIELLNEMPGKKPIIIYQPHQNIRQYAVKDEYKEAFAAAEKVYWLPTYLSREDDSKILTPYELSKDLEVPVVVSDMNQDLINNILLDLKEGYTIAAFGAGNIDDWFRKNFKQDIPSLKLR